MKPFGVELLLDLYDCDPETVNDLRACYDFLEGAVVVLGVHKQSPPFIFQSPEIGQNGEDWSDKRGLSGWIPIIESAVMIHTLVEKNFISIDYYTCGKVDDEMKERLIVYAKHIFNPKKTKYQFIIRGDEYGN